MNQSGDSETNTSSLHHTAKIYHFVYLGLLLFLVITFALSYIPMDPLVNMAISVTIAAIKTALIIIYFMHVERKQHLIQTFVISGFYWLGILMSISLSDYLTRPFLPILGK